MAIKGLLPRLKEVILGTPSPTGSALHRLIAPKIYSKGELLQHFTGYAYAAISPIAEEVARTTFYVNQIERTTGKEERKDAHPFTRLLRNPNHRQSKFQLLENSLVHYLMLGEFLWYMPRGENTNLPLQIIGLRPDLMTPQIDEETGNILGWKFRNSRGQDIPLDASEVHQVKSPNPTDDYRGWGVLQAALQYVMIEHYASSFSKNYLANNTFPGGVLMVKNRLTPEAWAKTKEQFKQMYSGVDDAGKVMMFQGNEGSFQKIGANLQEVALKDLKEVSSEAILNMFRVPKQVLGIPDNINLATSKVLDTTYAKRTIEPHIFRIEDSLQNLMDEYAAAVNKNRVNKVDLVLSHDSTIPEDRDAQLAEYEKGIDKWLTPNEVRVMENREPVVGGDTLLRPANLVPFGEQLPPEEKEVTGKVTLKTIRRKDIITLRQFNEYRKLKWEAVASGEVALGKAVDTFLKKQEKSVLARLKPKKGKKKSFDEVLFDEAEEREKFEALLIPVILGMSEEHFDIAGALVEVPREAGVSPKVVRAVQERVRKFARSFTAQTREKLSQALVDVAAAGGTVAEASSAVADVYGAARSWRTDMVARTELNEIANRSAIDAYQQAGVTHMVWFANPNCCEFCAELDGKIVSIDSDFVSQGERLEGIDGGSMVADFETVENPPLHPHCECDIVPQNDFETPFGDLPPIDERADYATNAR